MHEKTLRDSYRKAHEIWRISQVAWSAQHRKIESDKRLDRLAREAELVVLGAAPIEPIKPLLTAPEPTVEALGKHWPVLPGSLGIFSAEGGQMTGGHGFGPDHRLKTAAALSSLWDGAGIRRLRAGDSIADLPGKRLALHLMVQPDAAAAFLSEPMLRDQGLLSRVLIAAPESLAGTRIWKEPADCLDVGLRGYAAAILDLLERPAPAANEAGNELAPRVLDLSAMAKAAWVTFYNRIEAALAPDGALEGLRDVAGKAAENAARLAGVLTIVEKPDALTVEGDAMAASCELMLWYLTEAQRLSGVHHQSPSLRNAAKLLEWLRAKGKTEIAVREIMQFGPSSLRGKADGRRGWIRLELGDLDQWIELIALPRHYGGRQWYFLCPRTDRRASVLWKPPGARTFACRQAWGRQVAYGSQFQSTYYRASSAAQDIQRRLRKEPYTPLVGDELPPRPKGMHRRTYEKTVTRYEAYKTIMDQDLIAALARMMR